MKHFKTKYAYEKAKNSCKKKGVVGVREKKKREGEREWELRDVF